MKLITLMLGMMLIMSLFTLADESRDKTVTGLLPTGWVASDAKPVSSGISTSCTKYDISKRYMCKKDTLYTLTYSIKSKVCGYRPLPDICTCSESGKTARYMIDVCVPRYIQIKPSKETCTVAVMMGISNEEAFWKKGTTWTYRYLRPIGKYDSKKANDIAEFMQECYGLNAYPNKFGDGTDEQWVYYYKTRDYQGIPPALAERYHITAPKKRLLAVGADETGVTNAIKQIEFRLWWIKFKQSVSDMLGGGDNAN